MYLPQTTENHPALSRKGRGKGVVRGLLFSEMKNKEDKLEKLKLEMEINPEELSLSLKDFIHKYTEKLEREGVILGLSGGIDSAVVAALCKKAVGEKNTLALIMPEKDSKKEHIKDALNFAKQLGIKTKLIDITPYLEKIGVYKLFPLSNLFFKSLKEKLVRKAYSYYQKKTKITPFVSSMVGLKNKEFSSFLKKGNAYYRIKHRMRMLLLYFYGELENRLVIGAANKTEYKIGFFVKHGCDAAVDAMPLLNLYKTQIRKLARYLNVPSKIIEKQPSPDIIPGIDDEQVLTIPYEKLDLILLALDEGWDTCEIAYVLKIDEKKVIEVKNLIEASEYMRKVFHP